MKKGNKRKDKYCKEKKKRKAKGLASRREEESTREKPEAVAKQRESRVEFT